MVNWIPKIAGLFALLLPAFVQAGETTSAYTKIDLDKGCKFNQSHEMGGEAICTGYKNYPVHFAEGDLRQMVQYGKVAKLFQPWQSFGQFNRIGSTIEWRLNDGIPVATVLRWFVENMDEDTGMPGKKTEGQVLVVTTVGTVGAPYSCIAGLVDARANKDANKLARNIADTVAPDFLCGVDTPAFHGNKGPYSGTPSFVSE